MLFFLSLSVFTILSYCLLNWVAERNDNNWKTYCFPNKLSLQENLTLTAGFFCFCFIVCVALGGFSKETIRSVVTFCHHLHFFIVHFVYLNYRNFRRKKLLIVKVAYWDSIIMYPLYVTHPCEHAPHLIPNVFQTNLAIYLSEWFDRIMWSILVCSNYIKNP